MWEWIKRLKTFANRAVDRVLGRTTVRSIGEVNHVVNQRLISGTTQALLDDTISVAQWEKSMRSLLKSMYIEQYMLGRGGKEAMIRKDYNSIGGMLGEQYKYLRGFAEEIASGNLSPGQIANRAGMYGNSAREAYNRALRRAVSEDGKLLGKLDVSWNLGLAEHCGDCITFSAMGWIPAAGRPFGGAFPGSGDTKCLTNCKCYLLYRDKETGAEI